MNGQVKNGSKRLMNFENQCTQCAAGMPTPTQYLLIINNSQLIVHTLLQSHDDPAKVLSV